MIPYSRPKHSDLYTLFENYTLHSGTYPYSPYMAVPPRGLENDDLENSDLENDDLENNDLENNDLENDDLENDDLENDDLENDDLKKTAGRGGRLIEVCEMPHPRTKPK